MYKQASLSGVRAHHPITVMHGHRLKSFTLLLDQVTCVQSVCSSCVSASRKSFGYRNGIEHGFALREDQIHFFEMPAVGLGKEEVNALLSRENLPTDK